MKRVLLLVMLFPLPPQRKTSSTPSALKEKCSLSGMVVKLADSEPLRRARVILQSADDRTRSSSVLTDAAGRFQFKGIDPGRYHVSVSRAGFVVQEYGRKRQVIPAPCSPSGAAKRLRIFFSV